MNQPTLGLLERLRPPSGFRTEAALGATYSADLLTCMAVLTTLDGGEGDQVRYGRVEAYRALDRLRDKVRICHHAGRLSRRDGKRYPSLALLDRVLVPVRVNGAGSFHPKVWLVRQTDDAGTERFVLLVSSRNITTSTDWDLGIALEGAPGGDGVALPRVRALVEHTLELAGEATRIETFGALDAIRWTLPQHTRELTFDFQAGGGESRVLHRAWSAFPASPSRILLLSPFIDDRMVDEAATRWSGVPTRRLVAGTEGLLRVALGRRRSALEKLDPREIIAASDAADPPETEVGEAEDDEIEQVRALHAKVIAIDDGRAATLVIGSNNLTGAGWCGGSTEAFVRLTGAAKLCDTLWDWAGAHAEIFHFPEPGSPIPEPPLLETVKDMLHAVLFHLEDGNSGVDSLLTMVNPSTLILPEGVSLAVARYTTPSQAVPFPDGTSSVTMPGCTSSLRTRFIVCSLQHGDERTAWIASADVEPPIGDVRDHELVAELLGPREFLAYLQSLGSDEAIPGTSEDGPAESQPGPPGEGQALVDSVNLETLLRQIVADPRVFREMDIAVARYGELIRKSKLSSGDVLVLTKFLDAWSAIHEAFRS